MASVEAVDESEDELDDEELVDEELDDDELDDEELDDELDDASAVRYDVVPVSLYSASSSIICAIVSDPGTPSAVRERDSWKAFTAAFVRDP